jgi:filamentous hemagglutinin
MVPDTFSSSLAADGVKITKLQNLLNANGVPSAWVHSQKIPDLITATAGGNPAIAHIKIPGGFHYVVVDGVTTRMGKNVVAIRDPANGQQYFQLVSEFTKIWSGHLVVLQ